MKRVGAIVLAVCAVGCAKAPVAETEGEAPAPVTVETARVVTGGVDEGIDGPGTIVAAEGASARVAPLSAGRIARVFVREGERVTAGQPVAALEPATLAPQARAAAAVVDAARQARAQAQSEADASAAEQSATVRAAELALRSARFERDAASQSAQDALAVAEAEQRRIDAGPRPLEVAEAEAGVAQAEATLQRARVERERVQFLVEKGVLARRQRDDARTAESVAEAEVAAARSRLGLIREGARPEERAAARERTRQAANAVTQARATGDARVRQAEATLAAARTGYVSVAARRHAVRVQSATTAQREAESAAATMARDATLLRAPIGGAVVRRFANPGDAADPATPIVEVADTRRLVLVVHLPQGDAARVRIGARASAHVDGRDIHGVVRSIGVVDAATGLATVRIGVTEGVLPIGAFATASIVVRHVERALLVPTSALVNQEGKTVVYRLDDGKVKRVPVTVGVERGDRSEVRGALAPGNAVVTVGGHELTDGAAVTVAGGAEAKE